MDHQTTQQRIAVGVNEACAMAGWGRSTMYNLLRTGELPSFTIGKRRMVRIADLEQFIADQISA